MKRWYEEVKTDKWTRRIERVREYQWDGGRKNKKIQKCFASCEIDIFLLSTMSHMLTSRLTCLEEFLPEL